MSRVEEAVSRFKAGTLCAQVIFSIYAPQLGLDQETAHKIATPFGGGMARMGETCGAVTGAFMVIGLKFGNSSNRLLENRDNTYRIAREFVGEFKSRHGSIICKDILGCDLDTPEGRKTASEQGLFRTLCPGFIRDVATIIERIVI